MCLLVKPGCKIEIAKEPIEVNKLIFGNTKKFIWSNCWESYFRHTKHRYNKKLKATRHLKIVNGKIFIGFHAFLPTSVRTFYGQEVRHAIIPKGAEYCYGTNDEIVSNQIIVKS